jgi:hypothetical protein
MIEELEEAQLRIRYMRESLVLEGTIVDEPAVTKIEAKKRVLKHLDSFAAAVAGAHLCISIWEKDNIFNESEKNEMIKATLERLEKDINILPQIKDYYYCLGKHFDEPYGIEGPGGRFTKEELMEKRQIVQETLGQLEQLEREIDCILGFLSENFKE